MGNVYSKSEQFKHLTIICITGPRASVACRGFNIRFCMLVVEAPALAQDGVWVWCVLEKEQKWSRTGADVH